MKTIDLERIFKEAVIEAIKKGQIQIVVLSANNDKPKAEDKPKKKRGPYKKKLPM